MGRKILVSIDGSEPSNYAVKFYLDNMHREGDEVMLAHISPPAIPSYAIPEMGLRHDVVEKLIKAKEDEYEIIKQIVTDTINSSTVPKVNARFIHGEGDAGHELCKLAKDQQATMIVTGTRGQGKIRRTILGSVSDYIIHHAHIPVVVCKQE